MQSIAIDIEDERVNSDMMDESDHEGLQLNGTRGRPSAAQQNSNSAPQYPIPKRAMGAVEVPMIVMNLDRTEKAFGNISSFHNILDTERNTIPFYLNPESPFRRPIMSHSATSHNVVLKITVPKRTGRKRKKGSDGPWEGEVEMTDIPRSGPSREQIYSRSRLDNPKVLRRKMQDNVDSYDVEAVGVIKHTHRFRGMADFHWGLEQSPFISRFMNQVMPGDITQMRDFKFVDGVDQGPNVDIIPPPVWTPMTLPFIYNYSQNPYVRSELDQAGQTKLINTQLPTLIGYFLKADQYPIPDGPQSPYDGTDEEVTHCIARMQEAMEERPIWTRRSLMNKLGSIVRNANVMKRCVGYVGYQFRGGPWRDAIIKYGIDPRTDPAYRMYQTMIFNMRKLQAGHIGETWHAIRSLRTEQRQPQGDNHESHVFDGKSYWTDGKVWQICDISDPLIAKLFAEAPQRPEVDIYNSGWYHQGTWAKAKGIMKTKMIAIQFGRKLKDDDFSGIFDVRDTTPPPGASSVHVPLPDLELTDAEKRVLYGRRFKEPKKKRKGTAYRVTKSNGPRGVAAAAAAGSSTGTPNPETSIQEELMSAGEDSLEEDDSEGDDDEDGDFDDDGRVFAPVSGLDETMEEVGEEYGDEDEDGEGYGYDEDGEEYDDAHAHDNAGETHSKDVYAAEQPGEADMDVAYPSEALP
ncbi:RNA polymerase iii transcription factor [Colletotrichum higginsianum IMI 349063]|uniref:RNA polymerase iii transcription factor n=2 Tax=Colletotrichum higginsianum TaxID=80884 RepID=A0A1B7YI54_COLHI|nr:RNA polymerase iii transcription factor [Colletotrichum higginsianum IMI 349063]OBR11759.1 RNA polymerase iii transcription factor [Colletotrichum higginsianum IMI 349063]TIC99083.1 Transcription factor tau subunit sfc1 [Colletotrichum higginsianum]GJC93419.1 RNA polymerase iii transcription factor [Colletotrichum higginsianum]